MLLGGLLCGALAGGTAGLAAADERPGHEAHEREEAAHAARADRALLEEAGQVDEQVLVERARVTRLHARARTEEYLARLEAAAGKPGAQAARDRLVAAWTASAESVTQWWPVSPVRVCGNERLNFETALQDGDEGRREATAAEGRVRLARCVESARRVVGVMTRASAELEDSMRAAESVVGPASIMAPRQPQGAAPAPEG